MFLDSLCLFHISVYQGYVTEGQIKKLGPQAKLFREVKHTETQQKEKIPKRQPLTGLATQLEEINQKILAKEGRL